MSLFIPFKTFFSQFKSFFYLIGPNHSMGSFGEVFSVICAILVQLEVILAGRIEVNFISTNTLKAIRQLYNVNTYL